MKTGCCKFKTNYMIAGICMLAIVGMLAWGAVSYARQANNTMQTAWYAERHRA